MSLKEGLEFNMVSAFSFLMIRNYLLFILLHSIVLFVLIFSLYITIGEGSINKGLVDIIVMTDVCVFCLLLSIANMFALIKRKYIAFREDLIFCLLITSITLIAISCMGYISYYSNEPTIIERSLMEYYLSKSALLVRIVLSIIYFAMCIFVKNYYEAVRRNSKKNSNYCNNIINNDNSNKMVLIGNKPIISIAILSLFKYVAILIVLLLFAYSSGDFVNYSSDAELERIALLALQGPYSMTFVSFIFVIMSFIFNKDKS